MLLVLGDEDFSYQRKVRKKSMRTAFGICMVDVVSENWNS